jgi:uncharacterized glyoxalase superfamily protein PhnB
VPNRMIRETILTSPTLDQLSGDAERLWHRLTVVADDFGRFDADPRVILARCFPLKTDELKSNKVSYWFQQLLDTGAVVTYSVNNRSYGQFVNWSKHQRKRASHSKFPDPPSSADICCQMSSERRETRDERRETRDEKKDGACAPPAAAGPSPAIVRSFHDHVLAVVGKSENQLRLTDKRKARIRRRWIELEKLTAEPETALLGAVMAHSRSEWHVVNGYTDPYEYVLRSAEKVDDWLERARKAGITAEQVKEAICGQ